MFLGGVDEETYLYDSKNPDPYNKLTADINNKNKGD
jgi:hypothetical protein